MLEHPIVNNDYRSREKISFRDEKPEKFIAGPNFTTQIFIPHKERIKVCTNYKINIIIYKEFEKA